MLNRKQSITFFDDDFSKEYREILRMFASHILMGRDISQDDVMDNLKLFLSYFDLSNEEIFLRYKS